MASTESASTTPGRSRSTTPWNDWPVGAAFPGTGSRCWKREPIVQSGDLAAVEGQLEYTSNLSSYAYCTQGQDTGRQRASDGLIAFAGPQNPAHDFLAAVRRPPSSRVRISPRTRAFRCSITIMRMRVQTGDTTGTVPLGLVGQRSDVAAPDVMVSVGVRDRRIVHAMRWSAMAALRYWTSTTQQEPQFRRTGTQRVMTARHRTTTNAGPMGVGQAGNARTGRNGG